MKDGCSPQNNQKTSDDLLNLLPQMTENPAEPASVILRPAAQNMPRSVQISVATLAENNPIDLPIVGMVPVDMMDVHDSMMLSTIKGSTPHGADGGLRTIIPPCHAARFRFAQALSAS